MARRGNNGFCVSCGDTAEFDMDSGKISRHCAACNRTKNARKVLRAQHAADAESRIIPNECPDCGAKVSFTYVQNHYRCDACAVSNERFLRSNAEREVAAAMRYERGETY